MTALHRVSGVTFTIEAAFSSSTGSYGVWDVGLWDTATWGPDIIWSDITAYVRQLTTARRFSRDLQQWEAGTATLVLDNRDGRFTPDNLSGPYVAAGVTGIRPWRPIRIRATYAGTTYYMYAGYTRHFKDSWLPGPGTGKGDAVTYLSCVDEIASLTRFDGLEMASQGGGETSGKRIHRILNNAGHTGPRDIDNGVMTMQATTLARNAVEELKLTADSEGGALYVLRDGTVCFDNAYALIENARSNTIQSTFGDAGGSQLGYYATEADDDGDLMKNIVSWARQNGAAVTSTDDSSRSLYGDARSTRTDLMCETDTQVQTLTDLYLARYKAPEVRSSAIELRPLRAPANLLPVVLGREVRDLVRVIRTPPGGFTITRDVYIAGISHAVTPHGWSTRFDLWSSAPYSSYTTDRWDTGLWDTATWFF